VLLREGERLLVARARLRRRDALLEPVVAGHEQLADLVACRFDVHAREATLAPVPLAFSLTWLRLAAGAHVIIAVILLTLILMHSGRDAGLGGMGFTPASQGGTHVVERNLTRLTIVVAVLFFGNTLLLYHLFK
jgi:preprotein translocase subunit SecG